MGGVYSRGSQVQVTLQAASDSNVYVVEASDVPIAILPPNPARKGAIIYNNSSFPLYIKFGYGVTENSITGKILSGSFYEMGSPAYTGMVQGVWEANEGKVHVTELI